MKPDYKAEVNYYVDDLFSDAGIGVKYKVRVAIFDRKTWTLIKLFDHGTGYSLKEARETKANLIKKYRKTPCEFWGV